MLSVFRSVGLHYTNRMVLERQLPKRTLDHCLASAFGDLQQVIVIPPAHAKK
jgi:hypothetical protein